MKPILGRRLGLFRLRELGRRLWRLPIGRARSWRAERAEERDWRRRIILASRKIQQVQLALGGDLEDVRGLRAGLERSAEGIGQLERYVARAEELFGSIETRLAEHDHALHGGLERLAALGFTPPPAGGASAAEVAELRARVQELQVYARGRDELCQRKEADLARLEEELRRREAALARATVDLDALKSEVEEHGRELAQERDELRRQADAEVAVLATQVVELRAALAAPAGDPDADRQAREELEALLVTQQERLAAAETKLAEKEAAEGLELAHAREELDVLRRMSEARIAELETQNRLLEAAPASFAARREEEVARVRDQARQRTAALELEVRRLEAAREEMEAKHGAELDRLREESEWRIQGLEERAQRLEKGRGDVEEASQASRREVERRLAELEEELRAERGREQRIAELEAEVARGVRVRDELDVLHAHEIARLRRAWREEVAVLQEAAAGAARGAAPAAAPPEGAVEQLEGLLQEREAVLDLLRRRNEELERQVAAMTAAAGDPSWPPAPFPVSGRDPSPNDRRR
ncbi:MAG: hypothetical protein AB1726_10975 [Planctomycetota bacterium]